MMNSLVTISISQNGLNRNSAFEARRQGCILFTRVLVRGKQVAFWQKVCRLDNKLQSLGYISSTAKRHPAKQTGIVTVPVKKIVGSEGRTKDFDRKFNPLNELTRDRWVSIFCARRKGVTLPPVELIQVGEEYYVRDGHHRISVAHADSQAAIEAQILYVLEKVGE
jgi:hypothetical protein